MSILEDVSNDEVEYIPPKVLHPSIEGIILSDLHDVGHRYPYMNDWYFYSPNSQN
jgi:hypothetical protein